MIGRQTCKLEFGKLWHEHFACNFSSDFFHSVHSLEKDRGKFWFKNLHFRRFWAISISIFSRSRSFILTPTPFLSTLTSFTGTGTFRPSPSLPNPEPTLNPIFIISLRPLFSGSASVKLDFISLYFHKIPFVFSNWILKSYLVANASSLASIICSAIRFRLFSRCCSLCSASFCLNFVCFKNFNFEFFNLPYFLLFHKLLGLFTVYQARPLVFEALEKGIWHVVVLIAHSLNFWSLFKTFYETTYFK